VSASHDVRSTLKDIRFRGNICRDGPFPDLRLCNIDDIVSIRKNSALTPHQLNWSWRGKSIEVGIDIRGEGPTILMLPALSSISTRSEMRPLAERLASDFTTIAVDWPGFGDRPRPAVAWEPNAYRKFLDHILQELPKPTATVAAGHAAGYSLAHAAEHPGSLGRLCLVAPTWRGPLPTMMGGRHAMFRFISRLVDLPVIGSALYRLNVNQPMIRMMGRGHVYADPAWLDQSRLAEKLAVTNAPGARHASFRFVAGELDPMSSRESFLATARRVTDPILVVYGAATPARSKAEMEALRNLPHVQSRELPVGKLAVHEEFPALVADAVQSFIAQSSGHG
jgi:pimeloyl-ACP methyl ester carboxylesterase